MVIGSERNRRPVAWETAFAAVQVDGAAVSVAPTASSGACATNRTMRTAQMRVLQGQPRPSCQECPRVRSR